MSPCYDYTSACGQCAACHYHLAAGYLRKARSGATAFARMHNLVLAIYEREQARDYRALFPGPLARARAARRAKAVQS